MKTPFELEWMGGAAEHHFRKARPRTEERPWGTVEPTKYDPAAVERVAAANSAAVSSITTAARLHDVRR